MTTLTPATASAAVPAWIQALDVVVDARLDADSETAWYLAAAPDQHDTIEVARLDGDGIETITEQGFERAELRFRITLDVAAAALDWRGLVYNAGV